MSDLDPAAIMVEAERTARMLLRFGNAMPYPRYEEAAELLDQLRAALDQAQERERRVRAVVSDWRSVILTMRDRDDGPRTIRLDQYLEGRAEAINRALDGPARSKT
jgi:hypothetical protein